MACSGSKKKAIHLVHEWLTNYFGKQSAARRSVNPGFLEILKCLHR